MKYIVVLILFISCGPAGKLRRAEKLIAKAEALGASITTDTVYIDKQVIIPVYKYDTAIKYQTLIDTLIINNEKVVTRIKVDTVTKTWYVDQLIKGDTVFIEVPVEVNTDIEAPSPPNPWPWIIVILVLIIIIFIIKK